MRNRRENQRGSHGFPLLFDLSQTAGIRENFWLTARQPLKNLQQMQENIRAKQVNQMKSEHHRYTMSEPSAQ